MSKNRNTNTKKISRSLTHSGTNITDARKGMAVVEARPFRVGIAVAQRGEGKDGDGAKNISGFNASVALCRHGETNPYGATVEKCELGTARMLYRKNGLPAFFPVSAQQNANTVKRKAQAWADQWIRDQEMYQLAKYTPLQVASVARIEEIKRDLAKLQCSMVLLTGDGEDTSSYERSIAKRHEEIKEIKESLKA